MITTQYGSEVKIIERRGDGWALCLRVSDGAKREWHVNQLRADTGPDQQILYDVLYGNCAA